MPSYSPGSIPGQQSSYGGGLGDIYSYGAENPYGPYSALMPFSAGNGASAGTTTTASSGPTASATDFLNGVLSGTNLPYDAATQGSEYSTASDMSAAAETANNEQATAAAQRGGASANDPSLQGARMNNQARRQGQNEKSMQDITSNAHKANFGAQMDAAGQLNQYNLEQERMRNGMMSSLMPYSGMGGGGRKPAGGNNFTGSSFLQISPDQDNMLPLGNGAYAPRFGAS